MDFKRLQEIATEFEAPETEASQKSKLFDELSEGVGKLISAQEKINEQLEQTKEANLQLQKTNSHYANRLASQYVDAEKVVEQKKVEEKKTRTLSDALGL
ncbi:scaffold protein [Bacillus phage vB_BceP_LY3]|uniref:Scaffold protein n=1 Tax=Bacillus phage vB_BceP_LY3 TaxID=2950458 RepID=A0AAE9S2C4_9CAUD|nr:scaffold protein [Bacillus phage vB_BceP_LY3]